ncbi:MAG: phosphatase PAP2 family protein, partial [Bacteroidota bacterium]
MISAMLDEVRSLDRSLLVAINSLNNPVLDDFFLAVTDRWIWIPAYILLAWYLFRVFRKDFFWLLAAVFVTVLFTDQFASSLLKPLVHRLRPCHVEDLSQQLHLIDGVCGGSFGFVSSHAANTFGLTSLVFFIMDRKWYWLTISLFAWSIVVSVSRVYLGVHYPLDIFGGALLGI